MNLIDLTGQRFKRLLVLSRAENNLRGYSRWFCRCDCGTEKIIDASKLRGGTTVSCGCHRKEAIRHSRITHRGCGTSIHNVWRSMKQRCLDKDSQAYDYYGGRGITICDRWLSFEAFREDLGEKPAGMSLDRIDNNGPYSPENCRWASAAQQARNRKSNINVVIDNRTMCLSDWCNQRNLNYYKMKRLRKEISLQLFGLVGAGFPIIRL